MTLDELRNLARSGDVDAMTRCGKRLLDGTDAAEGAAMLGAASGSGGAEASERVAVLLAAGVCTDQNWASAFDYLTRAAKLGWRPAREQLALLSARPDLAAAIPGAETQPITFWRELRASIDIDNWLRPPPAQSLSTAPQIQALPALLPSAVCNWLIERARPRLAAAQVYDPDTGGPRSASARTNREAQFTLADTDLVLLLARTRIAAAAVAGVQLEDSNVLHYIPGQQFSPHYDFLDPAQPGYADDIRRNGQRVATCLIYLNDDYDGGETEFPSLSLRHRGSCGDGLMFANVDAAGRPDRRSLHAGLTPQRGEKWLLSQFLRAPAA